MKHYIDEFVRLKCAPDLLAMGLFPNGKEITESMGCYRGVVNNLQDVYLNINNPDINVVVVGDGHAPRTGALFAFRSGWSVISIDPLFRTKEYNIKRLVICKCKIEELYDVCFDFPVIIILPHSHAKIKDVLQKINSKVSRHVLALPCCYNQDIPNKAYIGYTDTNIWSEKNTIKIWKYI